jgi:hypothetical protein
MGRALSQRLGSRFPGTVGFSSYPAGARPRLGELGLGGIFWTLGGASPREPPAQVGVRRASQLTTAAEPVAVASLVEGAAGAAHRRERGVGLGAWIP